jgi:hydrogenase expression/formation protein HypC
MCLAVPLRLISVNGTDAVGEVGGIQREVSVMMTPDVKVGDYVIVHAGFAIQVLDQQEAEENLELLRQIGEAAEQKQEEVRSRRAGRGTEQKG